jgi:chromosome segregation ATPase
MGLLVAASGPVGWAAVGAAALATAGYTAVQIDDIKTLEKDIKASQAKIEQLSASNRNLRTQQTELQNQKAREESEVSTLGIEVSEGEQVLAEVNEEKESLHSLSDSLDTTSSATQALSTQALDFRRQLFKTKVNIAKARTSLDDFTSSVNVAGYLDMDDREALDQVRLVLVGAVEEAATSLGGLDVGWLQYNRGMIVDELG